MRERKTRSSAEQLEFCAQEAVLKHVTDGMTQQLDDTMAPQAVIDELRTRLRQWQGKALRAESQLAIVMEERNRLDEKLRKLRGGIYGVLKNVG